MIRFTSIFRTHLLTTRDSSNTARNDEQTQRVRPSLCIAGGGYNVLLVHYVNGDMTAHLYGAKDGHYANALSADRLLYRGACKTGG